MAVCGPICALSSLESCAHSCSASGSFMKVLLEDELRGHRIDRLVLDAAKTALRLHRGKPLVDSRDGQLEPPLQLPREPFNAPGKRMRAMLAHRQADDQSRRAPFRNELFYLGKTCDGRQRMRGGELGLANCDANALETEIEGKDGAGGPLRHVPLRPAASRNRGRGAPSPPAGALRPACRR